MRQSNTISHSQPETTDRTARQFRAMLVDLNSGEKTVITSNDFVIGRSRRQADLRISHPCVSCVHSRFSFRTGGLHIEDCSRHGILLNGRRIDGGILQDGDLLQIINTRFRVVIKSTKRRAKVRSSRARESVPAANVTADNQSPSSSNLSADRSDWHIETTGTDPVRWLLHDITQKSGPVSYSTLQQMRKVGSILPDTMVRRVTGDRWHRAAEIVGLFAGSTRTSTDQPRRLKQPGSQPPRPVSMSDTDNLGRIGDATDDGVSPSLIAGTEISVLLGSDYNSATLPAVNCANSTSRIRDTSVDDVDLELSAEDLYALQALTH